jgi:hypothetical protein
VDEELAHSQVLMVSIQDPDAGASPQEPPPLEGEAEDPVGRGTKVHWKGKGSVRDPGPLQPDRSGFPLWEVRTESG